MRRIIFFIALIMVSLMVFTLTGCNLPDMLFKSSATTTPTTQAGSPTTTTEPANTLNSPSPTQSVSPSPINPELIIPTTSSEIIHTGMTDFVQVIAKVRPSVVAITTTIPTVSIFGGTFTQESAGSGWIIESNGLIVTNNHVVEYADSINVTLEDGRSFVADMVRTDPVSDLAVLKINAHDLPTAMVGDSSRLQVGEWVIAIGNSLGQGISATKGIVSALDVSISADDGQTLYGLIQTDAAINPGNSGGPLINMSGEVIGINSIKVAQVGVEGMGYAISTQGAMPLINDLITVGYVVRPWLGVVPYQVDEYAVAQLELSVNEGILLREVILGSPADKSA
jgi:serine protease Do